MAASISTFRPKPPSEQATQTLRELALELEGFSALGFGQGGPPVSELEPEVEARQSAAPLAPPVVAMPSASVPVLAPDAARAAGEGVEDRVSTATVTGAEPAASETAQAGEAEAGDAEVAADNDDDDDDTSPPRVSRRSRLLAWLMPWRMP